MRRSLIAFTELRQLLVDLGFSVTKHGKFWLFEHPPSGTVFGYRPCWAQKKVTLGDLHMTRRHLDLRGVLTEQAFDDLLRKATA